MSRDKDSSYYDVGGIETIDIIKAKLTKEQYKGYLLGNAIKYSCRLNWKTPDAPYRDMVKAANYLIWLRDIESAKESIPEGVGYLNNVD